MGNPEASKLQRKPRPKGHVIAVRITAENPHAGFKLTSESLQERNFHSSTNVCGYFSVGSAGGLHESADSQFGHIFAFGEDRGESRTPVGAWPYWCWTTHAAILCITVRRSVRSG